MNIGSKEIAKRAFRCPGGWILLVLGLLTAAGASPVRGAQEKTAVASAPEFFPLDNGVGRGSWTPVQQAGYRGPIGLQCYRIKGDPKENLGQSMRAWRNYMTRLAAQKATK